MEGNRNKFEEVFECLSDKLNLLILNEILNEDKYPRQISEDLNKPNSTINKKLKELESAGLVSSYYKTGSTNRRVRMFHFEDVEFPFGSVRDYISTTLNENNVKY